MALSKVTDEEFIELMTLHKSVTKVALIVGMSVAQANKRRRNIERKHSIQLVATPYHNTHYGQANSVYTSPTVINLGMLNGTVIVFSDAHFWPSRRTTAFKALLWLIEELKPSVVVNNGDAFDGASISRHPANGWEKTPSVLEELKACEMFLGEIDDAAKLANPKCKLIWTLGNHDARMNMRLAAMAPEFIGIKGFNLIDHFEDWQHTTSCFLNDKVMVKHRWKGGIHATHNNTMGSGVSIVTGHLHSLKASAWTDYNGTRWGVDTGTLSQPFAPQFAYAEDNPRNWRAGFAVLNLRDGSLISPEICMVNDKNPDCVEWRGELWNVSAF